jgi:hypothetical protein
MNLKFDFISKESLSFFTLKNNFFTADFKAMPVQQAIENFSFLEHTNNQRSTRFLNSLIGYDYKTGHYLGSSEKFYPYLILSFLEVARGIRKPS